MATATQQLTTQQIATIRTSNWLDVLAGVWLIASPFVLFFANESAALWSTMITGAVIAVLAAVRGVGEGYLYSWPSWLIVLAGVWLIAAPFFLGFASVAAVWNSVILGLVVIALSGWSIAATPEEEITDMP